MNRRLLSHIGAFVLAVTVSPTWAAEPELLGSLPVERPVDLSSLDWIGPKFSERPEERAKWQDLVDWAQSRSQSETDALRASFRERGVDAPALPESCYNDERCALIVSASAVADGFDSWSEFTAAARAAWPYVLSFRRVTDIVAEIYSPQSDAQQRAADARELQRRYTNDQILRYAFDGVPGRLAQSPQDVVYAMYSFALEADLRRADGENIEYALDFVSRRGGWPAPPEVSEDTVEHLWALVQHGDHRPDLQYDALLAMQRRYAGESLPQQYGYLHDRVMLKLTGKQIYGTQVTCINGKRAPHPLDDSGPIDTLRAQIGLPPLAGYLEKFPDCSVAP